MTQPGEEYNWASPLQRAAGEKHYRICNFSLFKDDQMCSVIPGKMKLRGRLLPRGGLRTDDPAQDHTAEVGDYYVQLTSDTGKGQGQGQGQEGRGARARERDSERVCGWAAARLCAWHR
jgi:hypothetical protein